jgi:tetratricopeptide (TPR) repeat protein
MKKRSLVLFAAHLILSSIFVCFLPSVSLSQDLQQVFESLSKQADEARQQNRILDAIHFYKESVKLRPDWIEGWWYLGTLYYELDHFEEAIEPLKKVVSSNRELIEAWSLLGLCEYQVGKYEEALDSLQLAVGFGIDRQNQFALPIRYHLANLLNHKGEFEKATQLLGRLAAEGHYENPIIRESMGISLLRMQFLPKDIPAEYRQAVLIAGRANGYYWSAQFDSAVHEMGRLARLFPKLPHVHYAFGNLLARIDSENCLEEYQKELQISPNHFPALWEVSAEYLRRGKPEDALPYAERALALDENSFAAHLLVGRVLLQMERIEESISHLEKAVAIAPDSPEVHFSLSRAYQRAGRRDEAKKAIEEFQRLKDLRDKADNPANDPVGR